MTDPEKDRKPLRVTLVVIILILLLMQALGGSMAKDYREDGRFIKEDGDKKQLKNDPHNIKNLVKRNRDPKGDGYDQYNVHNGWKPTAWNDTGAGKGDKARPVGIPKEVYGYRYDLATGRITQKEFDKLMEEYNS